MPGLSPDQTDGLVALLPRLALNWGWLRLMGSPRVEQTTRQAPTADDSPALRKARRNSARKADRYRALATARPIGWEAA